MCEEINKKIDELVDDLKYVCGGVLDILNSISMSGGEKIWTICDDDMKKFHENVQEIFDKYFDG